MRDSLQWPWDWDKQNEPHGRRKTKELRSVPDRFSSEELALRPFRHFWTSLREKHEAYVFKGKQCSFVVLKRWGYRKKLLWSCFCLRRFRLAFGYWKLDVWPETGKSDNQLKTNDELLECCICITDCSIYFLLACYCLDHYVVAHIYFYSSFHRNLLPQVSLIAHVNSSIRTTELIILYTFPIHTPCISAQSHTV